MYIHMGRVKQCYADANNNIMHEGRLKLNTEVLKKFQSMLCPSRTVVEGLDKGLARINTALETSSYFII